MEKNYREDVLKKKYSKISELHPKEKNWEAIDKIYEFLKEESKEENKRVWRSTREIINSLPTEEVRVIKSSVAKLNESGYLNVFRNGNKFVYFAAENKDGSFAETIPAYEQDRINRFKEENFSRLVSFYEEHSELLNDNLVIELERVRASKDLPRPNWEAYNALVQIAWNNNLGEFIKLSLRCGAKKYSVK